MALIMKRKKGLDYLSIFTALMLLCNLGPFYIWGLLSVPIMRFVIIFLGCLPFLFNRRKLNTKDSLVIVIMFFTITTYILMNFKHEPTIFGSALKLLLALPFVFLFAKPEFLKRIFESFYTIYSLVVFLSLISYVFFIIGVAPLLGTLSSPLETEREFFHYPFLIIEMEMIDMFRFAGPFDEAGVIGTMSALFLFVKRFRINDFRSVVVLISGIASFSLFFYLISIGFIIINSIFVNKKPAIAFIILLLIPVLYINTKDNPLMYDRLWSRVEWDSTNQKLEGDSRTSIEAKKYYDNTIGSREWFWGLENPSYYNSLAEGSSSYINIIMWYGSVFLFLYLSVFVIYAAQNINSISKRLIVYFIILANTYQRPDIFGMAIIFFYSCLINLDVSDLNAPKCPYKKAELKY